MNFDQRLMNLAIGRVYRNLHAKASGEEKLKIERIFKSGSDSEKEEFMKKYLPNFESAYKKELAKLVEEFKREIS